MWNAASGRFNKKDTRMNFFSQQGEDIYIFYNFINLKNPSGVFVEIGGFDGITYSNSKFFEDTLGFSGVLIEPTQQFESMIKHRPKCKSYNLAVARNPEKMLMTGKDATAGLDDSMHPSFKEALHSSSESYLVDAVPFWYILKNSGISRIDLLTIDVEGGELAVLDTMDFSIPTYVIAIEMSRDDLKKDEACRDVLRKNKFILDRKLCGNEIWYNPEYPFIDSVYLRIPPPKINSIGDVGYFWHIERECIEEVKNAVCQGRSLAGDRPYTDSRPR
jgi:FkbM family methyltransferase